MALKKGSKPKKQASVSQSLFAGQLEPPTQRAVEIALGASNRLWKQIIAELKKELELDGDQWHSSGVKYGWALRLQKKDRNIVYLSPRRGWFLASFVLGDKALVIARKSELPAAVIRTIAETKR